MGPAELTLAAWRGRQLFLRVDLLRRRVLAAVGNLIRHPPCAPATAPPSSRLAQNGLWLAGGSAPPAARCRGNLGRVAGALRSGAVQHRGAMQFSPPRRNALPGYLGFSNLRRPPGVAITGRPPAMAISIAAGKGGQLRPSTGRADPRAGLGPAAGPGRHLAFGHQRWWPNATTLLLLHPSAARLRLRRHPPPGSPLRPRRRELQSCPRLAEPTPDRHPWRWSPARLRLAALHGAPGGCDWRGAPIAIMLVGWAWPSCVPRGIPYATTFRIGQHHGAGRSPTPAAPGASWASAAVVPPPPGRSPCCSGWRRSGWWGLLLDPPGPAGSPL